MQKNNGPTEIMSFFPLFESQYRDARIGIIFLCALILSLADVSSARCQIYQWVDAQGVRHFTDKPPPEHGRLIDIFEEEKNAPPPPGIPEGQAPEDEFGRFTVTRVYDGDSFEAEGHNITIQVRLAGIDAPETGRKGRDGQPFSRRAKDFLSDMIEKREVFLKGYGTGSYNRQLAEVFVDGTNVGLALLRAGLAETYSGPPPRGFDPSVYKNAESMARKMRLGVWSLGDDYESPSAWRKRK